MRPHFPATYRRLQKPIAVVLGAVAMWCASTSIVSAETGAELLSRGAYLAHAADCAACHTDTKSNRGEFAGGYAIPSPMGPIYSTNITPSKQYGIGDWSEAQFAHAVREGVKPDGTHLYPAMPYDAYSGISDDDIHALYRYFMGGVKPVDVQPTAQTHLGFPFNQRWTMAGWNMLFLNDSRFTPRTGESAELSRGRYLVDNLAHCSSCHTPRNTLMATDDKAYLTGATIEGWVAPNITSDPVSGVGAWTDAELTQFLRFGHAKDKAVAAGGMGEAVQRSLRYMSDSDLLAIAHYLKTVPAQRTAGQTKAAFDYGQTAAKAYSFDDASTRETLHAVRAGEKEDAAAVADSTETTGIRNGATLFDATCASCHQANGSGTSDNYYPSLYHSTAVGAPYANNLIMTILDGVDRRGGDAHYKMPGYRDDLNDEQVAAISNFVLQRFGNAEVKVDAQQVAELRNGGPTPLLARLGAWLVIVPLIVLAVIVVLLLVFLRRKKRRAALH